MKYALSDEERRRRRAETATTTKCECGNVAGLHQTLCGRCVLAQEQEALDLICAEYASPLLVEHRRMRELLDLICAEYASPLHRAEATADALRMIWEKIA